MKLAIILGTTRQGRQSERVAKWVLNTAQSLNGVGAELIDLKEYPMPFFEEPTSPRFNSNRQINEVAQKWLNKLTEAEAYAFVTPEYNHSIPGVLKNALDYVDWQLNRKPATIVSHGTVGGARATMHLKEIISEARAVPIPQAVALTLRVGETFDEQGTLSEEVRAQQHSPHDALMAALTELTWYSETLTAARSQGLTSSSP